MISIAIDGPSGAGKSSIAKELSKRLGFIYIDTGAMYRAIGLYILRKYSAVKQNTTVASLVDITLSIKHIDNEQRIFLNNEDVSEAIRAHEVSMAASDVSKIAEVRTFLLDLQRNFAQSENIIMDGRDIGTVILPNATVKIFLTASAEDRAKRRYDQLKQSGSTESLEKVFSDLVERDQQDSSRAIAPLKPAGDAIIVDTSGNSFLQSVDFLENIILEKIKK